MTTQFPMDWKVLYHGQSAVLSASHNRLKKAIHSISGAGLASFIAVNG
jgi:hypothetical protein